LTSWFNIKTLNWPKDKDYLTEGDLEEKYDQKELLESVDLITKIIEEEAKTLKSSKKVFLGGFLQGCCLTLAVYLKLSDDI
jgi:predicted esterase